MCDFWVCEKLVVMSTQEAAVMWNEVKADQLVVRLPADGDLCG